MDSNKNYDVIVVGGGAVGASALFALTQKGLKNVLLLEKKKSFGMGSTGSWGSLVRVYHANPKTTELALESVPYHLNFEQETGRSSGFVKTGSLYFLKTHSLEEGKAKVAALNRTALKLEIISAAEGKERFPSFQWLEDDYAIHEREAGYACPTDTTGGWISAACEKGATAKVETGVQEFIVEKNRVAGVKTEAGDVFTCGQVVLATGAWTSALMETCQETVPIVARPIQVSHFQRLSRGSNEPFFIDFEARTFGRPAPNGSFLGGYLHNVNDENLPFLQHLSLREAHEAKRKLSMRLNWIKNATLMGGIRAVEGYTADLNGVLRRSSSLPNVVIAAGWSCTGFTLAPTIGKHIAKLVTEV